MKSTTLNSTGFTVNIINLILIGFAALGVTTDLDGVSTVQAFLEKNYEEIFTFVVPSLIALGFKVWKTVQNKVDVWKTISASPNFWNYVVVTVLGVVTSLTTIVFPADAASSLVNAFMTMNIVAIGSAVLMNIITPVLYHLRDKKNKSV